MDWDENWSQGLGLEFEPRIWVEAGLGPGLGPQCNWTCHCLTFIATSTSISSVQPQPTYQPAYPYLLTQIPPYPVSQYFPSTHQNIKGLQFPSSSPSALCLSLLFSLLSLSTVLMVTTSFPVKKTRLTSTGLLEVGSLTKSCATCWNPVTFLF